MNVYIHLVLCLSCHNFLADTRSKVMTHSCPTCSKFESVRCLCYQCEEVFRVCILILHC